MGKRWTDSAGRPSLRRKRTKFSGTSLLHLPAEILEEILYNISFCEHGNQGQYGDIHSCPWTGAAFNISELGGIMLANKWLRHRCLEIVFGCPSHPTIHLPYIETDEDQPSQFNEMPLLGKSVWRRLNLSVTVPWQNIHAELEELAKLLASMSSLQSLKLSIAIKGNSKLIRETTPNQEPHLRDWDPIFSQLGRLSLQRLGFHLSVDAMPEDLIDPIRKIVVRGIRDDLMVDSTNLWVSDWGLKSFVRQSTDVAHQIQELRKSLSQMYAIAGFRLPCLALGDFDYYHIWSQPLLEGRTC